MCRVLETVLPLDPNRVRDFFEQRARKYNDDAPYSSVLYQDNRPEIAIERDLFEKTLIKPLLNVGPESRVLDIGCGIGRWAEVLAGTVDSYTGLDVSPGLVKIAKKRLSRPNVEFVIASAEEIRRSDVAKRGPFDLVVMSGIMIYLNDDALNACLKDLATLVVAGGQIYMREPLAVADRLTLSEFWSNELNQHYSAIYRSAIELEGLFANSLYPAGFEPIKFRPLYTDGQLNNREETVQNFAVAKRYPKS
jgi:SAM-dependent methyltransferase